MKNVTRHAFALAFATAVAALSFSIPASAMTEAECEAEWGRLDTAKAGTVNETVARRYFAAMRVANKPIADGKLTRTDFLNNCKAGLFDVSKVDAGAPLKGANSFTEGQAKDRAVAHGLSEVSALKKDADGVWRGTASHNGKKVNVAVDYKGNVVAK